jgi:type 1 glutamine amidotransferase
MKIVTPPEPVEITPFWIETIRRLCPHRPRVAPKQARRVLMLSVSTGYQHWVIPHTAEIVKALAETSGAFAVEETEDPESFTAENLARFDAVVFNNTCPKPPTRDIFLDILGEERRAEELRRSTIAYIADGGALISLHGGIIAFNGRSDWDEMHGGVFDNHPAQQELVLDLVEPAHPLAAAFDGKPLVHVDEPYLFTGTYGETRFRPLLVMDKDRLEMGEGKSRPSAPCYTAWIRRHHAGRVFYCSPSHNAQSFYDPRLLQFVLDGAQYAVGDLECDDTPLNGGGR